VSKVNIKGGNLAFDVPAACGPSLSNKENADAGRHSERGPFGAAYLFGQLVGIETPKRPSGQSRTEIGLADAPLSAAAWRSAERFGSGWSPAELVAEAGCKGCANLLQ